MLWETERFLSDKSCEIWAQFSGLPLTVYFYEATRLLGGCFLSCKMGIKLVQPKPCFEKQSSLNKNISILLFFFFKALLLSGVCNLVSGNENTNAGSRLTVGTHACFRRVPLTTPAGRPGLGPHRTQGAEQYPFRGPPHNEGLTLSPHHPCPPHQMGCLKPSPAHSTPLLKSCGVFLQPGAEKVPPQGLDLLSELV